jgi:hypothetical protein
LRAVPAPVSLPGMTEKNGTGRAMTLTP